MKQPNLLRIALLTLLVSMLGLGKSTAKDPYATFFKDTLTFYYE